MEDSFTIKLFMVLYNFLLNVSVVLLTLTAAGLFFIASAPIAALLFLSSIIAQILEALLVLNTRINVSLRDCLNELVIGTQGFLKKLKNREII